MENVEIEIVILKSRLSDQKNLEKSSMKIIWNIDQNINLYEFPFLNFVEFVSTSEKNPVSENHERNFNEKLFI
jgi:hypothetical protein